MLMSDEEAKAVQEVAKTTGQSVQLIEKIGSFVARVMGEPIEASVGMLSDTLKFKRWERQLRLIKRCQQIMEERGIGKTVRQVPPKLLLPIFHHASIEDNDELHDLWARLLVTATDPSANSVRSGYIDPSVA